MAPSAKPSTGNAVGSVAAQKPTTSNGVITEPPAPAVNRKKAKRRAKEKARRDAAAQQHATDEYASDDLDDTDLAPPGGYTSAQSQQQQHSQQPSMQYDPHYPNTAGEYHNTEGTAFAYSDEDNQYAYDAAYTAANGSDYDLNANNTQGRRSRKKKKKLTSLPYDPAYEEQRAASYYDAPPPRHRVAPTITEDALRTVEQKMNDDIWETSSREERDRIRQFWLRLPERERRDLVRIEKDAVLRKMKEQQKHSCSCTVCGRKRTAIEEELEMLYDAYYAELEGYANEDRQVPRPIASYHNVPTTPALPTLAHTKAPSRGRIHELPDDEEDDPDDLDDEDYEDEDDYSADDYGVDEYGPDQTYLDALRSRNDFFTFGRNLTVKEGILTVADDLLSNHGEKFIDMMEQLANARMRRENEAFASYSSQHLHDTHSNHYPEEDDYDEEDEFDEEDSIGDEYEEDDDEMDHMSDHQRMDEGRRMFQIFAARMFEQRVLGAYREDVSKKKAEQLIAEEEAEKYGDVAREAKKAREAEKKKARKQAKKQEKAEKEQRKETERMEAERSAREVEAKRQEEQRLKREEQKKRRDAEKKAQDEERRRKDEDRRRQQEELRSKQQDRERQAREAKALEKRRKEEERKKLQEEKDARAVAVRERKLQQERAQREQAESARAEAEASERSRKEDDARQKSAQSEAARKASMPAVALPPSLKHQKSQTGSQPSPQTKATTPAVPKATTPQQRQTSAAASRTSSSLDAEAQHPKLSTPPALAGPMPSQPPSSGSMRAPNRPPQHQFPPPMTSPHAMAPPPGMPYPPQSHFPGMPPHAINGLPASMNMPGVHHGLGGGRGMFPMGPQMNMPFRPGPHQSPHLPHGMGVGMPATPGRGFGYDGPLPPSSFNPPKAFGSSVPRPASGVGPPIGSHSRQPSSSFETSPAESSGNHQAPQPIGRPTPIQRPDSTKPERQNRTHSMPQHHTDQDEETFLGSSALLGDSEPSQESVERRQTAPHLPTATTSGLGVFGQHSTPLTRTDAGFASPLSGPPAGWGGWAGPVGLASAAPQRHGAPRLTMVRRLACDVLGDVPNSLEIGQLLNLVNSRRSGQEAPVQMHDLQSILDTEGDAQNGGGTFEVQSHNSTLAVRWRADRHSGPARSSVIGGASTTSGLGEIGSPMPSASRPF